MSADAAAGVVVAINGETMGRGNDKFGATLMGSYLRTLLTVDGKLDAIVFYNAAVRQLAPASPHLEALKLLDAAGVDLLACVTCLEFHSLTDQLVVGAVSNMREIVQRTMGASKVVTV